MATKITGISRDLIIHPGETISDILVERGITQAELAARTGVTPAYVCNVIAGKKDISAKFAFALEYALGVSKSFWISGINGGFIVSLIVSQSTPLKKGWALISLAPFFPSLLLGSLIIL